MQTTPYGEAKITSTRGKVLEQILDKFNFLCLDEKEEAYYRAYDGCKSTIDLTLANISITPEMIESNGYNLRNSDSFLMNGKISPNINRDGA